MIIGSFILSSDAETEMVSMDYEMDNRLSFGFTKPALKTTTVSSIKCNVGEKYMNGVCRRLNGRDPQANYDPVMRNKNEKIMLHNHVHDHKHLHRHETIDIATIKA